MRVCEGCRCERRPVPILASPEAAREVGLGSSRRLTPAWAAQGVPGVTKRARRELVRSVGPCLASWGAFASFGCFSFEFVQDVVGAARELARDSQDGGLSGLAARLDAPVQGTVGASPIAGLVRGLHERPAQLRRAVLGEVAAPRRLPGVGDD